MNSDIRMENVKAWEEKVVIPTYGIGKPEKNPLFLEKRVYQGSSGIVYPHPVIEKIDDQKKDVSWDAVFLENKYLKIMILPQLGGRIQMAYDKMKERHFIYYNQVIKPALVGLTGPWISGGIEFNWPQHHRPSTFEPVDHMIESHSDGSITVWCSELERMFRTRGMAGFRLYPDKAYLEINVKLYNRTNEPQTFLWWANPAVKVNEAYQSVFPPDVHAVFDHGKRDVSEFPIAKGTYYKVNYAPGTDISRYKNIPVPTSYMAVNSRYNFVGGYENDSKGGMLHVANHHVSPGKKQWTWGHSDFGKAWDRHLTDEDGPYIELMCGVYTDNQPDFSWLMPGEEKSFSQYFMPYRDLGVVKNATKEAMINLTVEEGKLLIQLYVTGSYPESTLSVWHEEKLIGEFQLDLDPSGSFCKSIDIEGITSQSKIRARLRSASGKELVGWESGSDKTKEIPEAAKPALLPNEISSVEQLYLTGLHLEQYRHATYDPTSYYLEGLKRDPKESRCNKAMGLWYYRRGAFARAESYFKTAISTLTERNPNPIDGEPYYFLGLSLRMQGRNEEAFDAFYKAVWNDQWMMRGYFQLAQLASTRGDWEEALELVDRSLIRNSHHHQALHLKCILLRKLKRTQQCEALLEQTLSLDSFNFGAYYEKILLTGNDKELDRLKQLIRKNGYNYLEFSFDYASAGFWNEAIDLVSMGAAENQALGVSPLMHYYKAWYESKRGDELAMMQTLQRAKECDPDYCFPNQIESVMVLNWALDHNNEDSKACYYLGNFWYHSRLYDWAIECWERSVDLDNTYPTVHRNLALAYFNKRQDRNKAVEELEKAFYLDPTDGRILMELDQLYKRLGKSSWERLINLEKFPELVMQRDDLYLERITLYNQVEQYAKAFDLIMQRSFHPWEGGEGKVTGQYVFSLTEMAKESIVRGEFNLAIDFLVQAQKYPENLGEGKLYGAQENAIFYWMGVACDGLNQDDQAKIWWEKAAQGLSEPAPAIFYNDQQPDTIYYQGLALIKLGRLSHAEERFRKLIDFGRANHDEPFRLDYFAVSLPDLQIWDDDLTKLNRNNCQRLIKLGEEGLAKIPRS